MQFTVTKLIQYRNPFSVGLHGYIQAANGKVFTTIDYNHYKDEIEDSEYKDRLDKQQVKDSAKEYLNKTEDMSEKQFLKYIK